MKLFDFICQNCGKELKDIDNTENEVVYCPECGKPMEKKLCSMKMQHSSWAVKKD